MKLDSRSKYMIRFPDKGTIDFNGDKIKTFHALDCNISTKFRRDDKVDLSNSPQICRSEGIITIEFSNVFDEGAKNSRKGENPYYIFGICVVKRYQPTTLINEIVETKTVTVEESKNRIIQAFQKGKHDETIAIDKLQMSSKCIITSNNIVLAGRVVSVSFSRDFSAPMSNLFVFIL